MRPDSVKLPPQDDMHDLIIVPQRGGVERLRVTKEGSYEGNAAKELPSTAVGGRKSRAVAQPGEQFGPAMAISPTRPEPAAQNGTCNIVNQHNVRIRNPWTAARLNNEPSAAPDPYNGPLPKSDRQDAFDILIAGPMGKVYHVEKRADAAPTVSELHDLRYEGDIWYQLRNGFVAGSTRCFALDGKLIPMVNVLALTKEK
jgi:hypothetical protein